MVEVHLPGEGGGGVGGCVAGMGVGGDVVGEGKASWDGMGGSGDSVVGGVRCKGKGKGISTHVQTLMCACVAG